MSHKGHPSSFASVIALLCSLVTEEEALAAEPRIKEMLEKRPREETIDDKVWVARWCGERLHGAATQVRRYVERGPSAGMPPAAQKLMSEVLAAITAAIDAHCVRNHVHARDKAPWASGVDEAVDRAPQLGADDLDEVKP